MSRYQVKDSKGKVHAFDKQEIIALIKTGKIKPDQEIVDIKRDRTFLAEVIINSTATTATVNDTVAPVVPKRSKRRTKSRKSSMPVWLATGGVAGVAVAIGMLLPRENEDKINDSANTVPSVTVTALPLEAPAVRQPVNLPVDSAALELAYGRVIGTGTLQDLENPKRFEIEDWSADFKQRFRFRNWVDPYIGGPYFQWWEPELKETAEQFISPLGPLGVMVLPINSAWQQYAGFDTYYPNALRGKDGDILVNAFEVKHIQQYGPLEDVLSSGDLIVAMDDVLLQDARLIEPETLWPTKYERSLRIHAGWLLDRAEARGGIRLSVIRKEDISNLQALPESYEAAETWQVADASQIEYHFSANIGHAKLSLTGPNMGIRLDSVYLENGQGAKLPLLFIHEFDLCDQDTFAIGTDSGYEELEFLLPPGEWVLRGNCINSGQTASATLSLQTLSRVNPLERWQDVVEQIEVPLDQIGAWPLEITSDCDKAQHMTHMAAQFIVSQQYGNGSWPRRRGYTSSVLDTASCVIGLLAADDERYMPSIEKGIEFLASDKADYDSWSFTSSLALIAMGEYWLRTGDDSVLPAMQLRMDSCVRCMSADYTMGHKATPGYRDRGVSYGGAHMALALAVLSKTPVDVDEKLLQQMLIRVQELSPHGIVPYGRGNYVTLDSEPENMTNGARNGPYLVAARLLGGPKLFVDKGTYHLSQRRLGAPDQGHTSKSFSLWGSTIGIATCAPEMMPEHLRRHAWALTSNRRFDGGYHWGADPIEYMGAEKIMHTLYRTSTYLIALNADKHNMAVTGRPDLLPDTRWETPLLDSRTAQVYQGWLSRMHMIKAAVLAEGKRVPSSITQAIEELIRLRAHDTTDMQVKMFAYLEAQMPTILSEIRGLRLSEDLTVQLNILALGIEWQATMEPTGNQRKVDFEVRVVQPFAGRYFGQTPPTEQDIADMAYRMGVVLTIHDPSGEWLKEDMQVRLEDIDDVNWLTMDIHDRQRLYKPENPLELELTWQFNLNDGTDLQLETQLHWPMQESDHSMLQLPIKFTQDFIHYTAHMETLAGENLPAVVNGPEGATLPAYREGSQREYQVQAYNSSLVLPEGTEAVAWLRADISRPDPISVTHLTAVRLPEVAFSKIYWRSRGRDNHTEILTDWDEATSCAINPSQVLNVHLEETTTPKSIHVKLSEGATQEVLMIEARDADGKWHRIGFGHSVGGPIALLPIETAEMRVYFDGDGATDLEEVHVFD